MLITSSSLPSGIGCSTYTLAGLEVNLRAKRWLAMLCLANTRGIACVCFRGLVLAVGGRAVLTISRMVGVPGVVRAGGYGYAGVCRVETEAR